MKENFKDFQGLGKGLLKFKGFQEAYAPCNIITSIICLFVCFLNSKDCYCDCNSKLQNKA